MEGGEARDEMVWWVAVRLSLVCTFMVYSLSFRFTVANDIVIKGHGNDTF